MEAKWKDRIRLTLFAGACVVLALALVLPGCNTWQLPQAKSQARQKAALIADKKVELHEKAIELELKAKIKMGPAAEAAVLKAKGRV